MGCGVSKIDNREEEMEDDSMYVYYNLLPHRPEAEDRLVDFRRHKVVADPAHSQLLIHKEAAGLFIGPDPKGGDKDNIGVPGPNTISSLSSDDHRPTKANNEVDVVEFKSCVVEQAPGERVMKERNNVVLLSNDHESAGMIVEENGIDHNNAQQRRESRDQLGLSEKENTPNPRSPSVGNYRFSGVHGSDETAKNDDGEIIRMKKLDIIIDGEKEEDNNVDTCTEIILSTHHPLREFACKNLRNKQLPRSLSLKKNRRKWRRFRVPGPRSCSGSVKSLLIDDTDSRYPSPTRKSCSNSSDIHVKYYSLQV